MANRHWPGEDPIGQRITIGVAGPDAGWLTIVGVVEDVVRGDWAAPPEDEYYLPLAQTRSMLEEEGAHISYITLVARAADDAAAIAPAVRHAVHEIDPNVAISDVRTMKDVLAAAVAPSRFPLILMAVFAVVALLLAMVGILGMTSYSLSKRTHEIGIRMALGARPLRVFGGLVGHGLIVAIVGVAIGLAGASFLTRLMATMLFGVTATDPITFGAVSLMLALVGVTGSAIPAWRLLRTDPVSALRTD
jgi:putative ABC transport system permease protein